MRYLLIPILFIIIACKNKNPEKTVYKKIEIKQNLVAELDTIWETEQIPIQIRDSLGRVHGFESEAYQKQDEIYHKNHTKNEARITHILDSIGWPDSSVIGERGNLIICNVIQHATNDVRLKYLPLMKQAVKDKKLEPRLLARAEDRIATELGKPQIYGGQIKYYPETKSFDVWPIKDPENVDQRRAEIGLIPIAEFLQSRRNPLEWDLEKQIKRTKAFEAKMLLENK